VRDDGNRSSRAAISHGVARVILEVLCSAMKQHDVATRERIARCPWSESFCENERSSSGHLGHAQRCVAMLRNRAFEVR